MNHELAKQLKDAGYPQGLTEHQYGWVEAHQAFELDNGDMTVGVSVPTLSELIEACGDKFVYLHKQKNQWNAVGIQMKYEDKQSDRMNCGGSTPEEAVTNLWLALNKE